MPFKSRGTVLVGLCALLGVCAGCQTQAMNKEQASVSKLERRDDMYIGTLQAYVQALGGELKLIASFPDADIQSWPERKSRS